VPAQFRDLAFRYYLVPLLGVAAVVFFWGQTLNIWLLLALGALLIAAVFVAVNHAEVIALRVKEPFGSLVLAVSVTVIEVAMIVVLMLQAPKETEGLARDAVFGAVMIAMNGIVGISLLTATRGRRVATFIPAGVGGAVSVLVALATLSLVLPSFTISSPGPTFTTTQLALSATVSLFLYGVFLFFLTVQHRDYFLPEPEKLETGTIRIHVEPPTKFRVALSLAGLLTSLVAIIGLAQLSSPLIQESVTTMGLPQKVVGLSIALVVLLPESLSAVRAARLRRTQTSLNLAYGSALASIGLTIPTVAVLSIVFGYQLNLGLSSAEIVLLAVTLIVSAMTVLPGKASAVQGAIHLAIFGSFLAFVVMP
jgi:Ca2+:H+ antiporter